MNRPFRNAFACIALVLLSGCGFVVVHGARQVYKDYTKQDKEVEAALARYRTFVLEVQPQKVAEMFEPNGELSHDSQSPVVGRKAILTLLNSSAAYKVIEYEVTATSTTVSGQKAIQTGSYRRKVVAPSGEAVAVRGTFEAQWAHQPDGRWLISRMHTASGSASNGG